MPSNAPHTIKIAPSILSADFTDLARSLSKVAHADLLHVDVMDNHFVPNLSFGPMIAEAASQVSTVPLDVHLMIENPADWIDLYLKYYNVTFHLEAVDTVQDAVELARRIRSAGVKAGLSIKPGTDVEPILPVLEEFDTILIMSVEPGFGGQKFMPEVLPKVEKLREAIDAQGLDTLIEIDGGINNKTIAHAVQAGVDIAVAGSAVFDAKDPQHELFVLKTAALDA